MTKWALWGLLATQLAWSQPVGVILVDGQGHWDALGQSDINLAGAVTDAKSLMKDSAVRRLSYQQRQELLHEPERLLSSKRASELFSTTRLLLLEPSQEGRVLGTYYDLDKNYRIRIASEPHSSADLARQQLVQMAQNQYGPQSVPVIANAQSRRYHLRQATHLSPDAPLQEMVSSYQAREQGYRPCDICFEPSSSLPDQDSLEKELGRTLAQQIESQFRLSQDPVSLERVQRVGQRLLSGNLLDHDYQFVVLDSDRVNAFAVPTGPLYVTSGLLAVVESDDELAGVLGHELAHSELHHGRRQYEQAQQWSWLGLLAGIATRNAWLYSATQAFGSILSRGYSRDFELEADQQGAWYAYGAGYRADHFKLTLQKLGELEKRQGGGGISWLRTHPGSDQRLQEIDDILGRLEPLQLLLEEIEPEDPGLAAHLKRKGAQFLNNPKEVVGFYSSYRVWVGTRQ